MNETEAQATSRRVVPLVWGASALAAMLLVLGVNGTLSSWTSAIVVDDDSRVGTIQAVILKQVGPDSTGGDVTCASSAEADNNYTCTVTNVYGDDGVVDLNLAPGESVTSTLTFENTGGLTGANFGLTAGSCVSAFQSPLIGTPATPNLLCEALTVAVACTGDATLSVPAVALASFSGGSFAGGGLAHGETSTCMFTVALPGAASPLVAGQTATQDLTWTLSQ
ncbi:MAG: hypothetical protein WB767_08170 [Nocardioides sp.]